MKMTTRLRQLLAEQLVVAPGCYDALSARLAEIAGFDAIHLPGWASRLPSSVLPIWAC